MINRASSSGDHQPDFGRVSEAFEFGLMQYNQASFAPLGLCVAPVDGRRRRLLFVDSASLRIDFATAPPLPRMLRWRPVGSKGHKPEYTRFHKICWPTPHVVVSKSQDCERRLAQEEARQITECGGGIEETERRIVDEISAVTQYVINNLSYPGAARTIQVGSVIRFAFDTAMPTTRALVVSLS